ncbi:hypothetical protein [Flaviaesturariibacter aridisoli]|uniref:Uncharacterized protein n=1 Tax=Flaviaesturariibacter aridisoli TaxID=2545761 RepID=A0A4R4DV82_9BACT|nr:hypothetical protein [Flaviaesturariibacter aridisoli]TCZ67323.1 hypothetical protein E0486_15885 [Flaviaesturariibacter aridisoli]
MESYNTTQSELLHDQLPKKLPSTLNVLTILTFIGCGIAYISALWGLVSGKNAQEQADKIRDNREQMGDGFMGKWMDASLDMMQRAEQYKYINLVVALLFTTLCLVGALQMRKLKKQGFSIWAIGEWVPIVVMFILMGTNLVTMVMGGFSVVVALVFTLLYAGQRKYMN